MLLKREAILAANDVATEQVDVPEWGGSVLVRGLTAGERDKYEQSLVEIHGKGRKAEHKLSLANVRAKLASLSIVDEDGTRLFDDSDIVALGKKSASALQRVFDVAQRLSGLSNEDVEELAGNSETTTLAA